MKFLSQLLLSVVFGLFGAYLFSLQNSERSEATPAIKQEESYADLVDQISPSVVSIFALKDLSQFEYSDPFFSSLVDPNTEGELDVISSGTGFFISPKGYILTNKHVVSEEASYSIMLSDGAVFPAVVIARDPLYDIAVIMPEMPLELVKPLSFIEDRSFVRIGDKVLAIGNALGEFQNSVTSGIISGKGRSLLFGEIENAEDVRELLQTDAAINPGNSGGPLITLEGKVVGMNTAIADGENLGFSLPFDEKRKQELLSDIEEYGRIVRPYLGVHYQMIMEGEQVGAKIVSSLNYPGITPESPADKAGLKEGDFILAVDGAAINDNQPLAHVISKRRAGEQITFSLLRDGKEKSVSVTLGAL